MKTHMGTEIKRIISIDRDMYCTVELNWKFIKGDPIRELHLSEIICENDDERAKLDRRLRDHREMTRGTN